MAILSITFFFTFSTFTLLNKCLKTGARNCYKKLLFNQPSLFLYLIRCKKRKEFQKGLQNLYILLILGAIAIQLLMKEIRTTGL